MRRLILAIVVGLLTLSASGLSSLVVNEPCTSYELPGADDGACPPMCVTCGCCAQAVDTVMVVVATAPASAIAEITAFLPPLLRTNSRDILHVPKPA